MTDFSMSASSAEKPGALPGRSWEEQWDTVIIGGGPAGVAAGIYAVRGGLKTLLIEKSFVGGQIALTNEVENYPAALRTGGMELAQKLDEHLKLFATPVWMKSVSALRESDGGAYLVEVDTGEAVPTKTIIIASGSSPNRLPAENEEKFYGKGVSYCAVCDGPFFKDQHVAVVGGGDAAVEEAEYLSNICSQVTLIHRREGFRAQPIALERLRQKPNVNFKLNYVVTRILGEETVEKLVLKNVRTEEEEELAVSGVFGYIGHTPNTDFAKGFVRISDDGQVLVDSRMRTDRRGVFAVGDLTYRSLRQMVISCGEGCTAAIMARRYISDGKWPEQFQGEV